ncbi:MAG: hypothetical protein IRZ16_23135 [Myxococcaceae bacterium]|nr:hypothetical protein [Myxococcaceae bacterium]
MGGAGRAGGRPPELVEAQEIHPQGPVEEGALGGTVHGTIVDTGPSLVVIADRDGRRFWLTLSTHTVITEDGRPSSALALDRGAEVTASFISEEPTGRQVITRISVHPPPR